MDRPRRIGVGAGAAQDRRSRERSSGEIQKVTADYVFHSGKLHRTGMMGKPPQPGVMQRRAARAGTRLRLFLLDVGGLDHLRPLRGVADHYFLEIRRAADERCRAELTES